MVKKHQGRKTSEPRRVPPADSVAASEAGKSVGAALDEAGFKPLGRRIIVGRGTVRGNRDDNCAPDSGETQTPVYVTPSDDPLGYDPDDPDFALKVAKHALSGDDRDLVSREVNAALRRWKLRD